MGVRAWLTWVVLAIAVLAGCGEDDEPEPNRGAASSGYENPPFTARVEITKDGYRPRDVRILVGGRVTFVNVDASEIHTAQTADLPDGPSDDNEFDTHSLTWEEPYTVTFHKPGKIVYYNSLEHGMKGTVEAVPKR